MADNWKSGEARIREFNNHEGKTLYALDMFVNDQQYITLEGIATTEESALRMARKEFPNQEDFEIVLREGYR